MALTNGTKGDHPLTDIVSYNLDVFSPDVDAMVRELHELGGFQSAIDSVWLLDQSYLMSVARETGRAPYGRFSLTEEDVLSGLRNALGSELRRLKS